MRLNTLVKDEALKKTIEEMKVHEKEHSNFFEEEIKKRNIKPTKFLPLWDLLGVGLSFAWNSSFVDSSIFLCPLLFYRF